MLLGVIADDFTGAGDVANTLAREGMHTRLFVDAKAVTADCDAGVVALKSRSVPVEDAVAQSLEALEILRASGAEQIMFKYCSTFDSTPVGNIGPVAEALAEALGVKGVVVCPAFPGNLRTVFQGHLFVGDVLLSESGMARHPLTPMTDADLRRWLARQSRGAPGHVPLHVVRQGSEAIERALLAQEAILVVVDATEDSDLRAIGAACANAPLLTGGSGVALGLPANFCAAGALNKATEGFSPRDGPAIVLSGSCSMATLGQVEAYKACNPSYAVSIDALAGGDAVLDDAEAFLRQHGSEAPLFYSTATPKQLGEGQTRHGAARVAELVETFFGKLASCAVASGFERIVVAGGETSGAVVTALGLSALEIGPEIATGVPAVSAVSRSGHKLALALKSGNFGGVDVLSEAVTMLGAAR